MSLSLSAGYTINIVTRPSARPSIRPSALVPPPSHLAPHRLELRLLFSLRMHRPYTGPIMYSVRDFVFDKYKSTPWSGGAARRPVRRLSRNSKGVVRHRDDCRGPARNRRRRSESFVIKRPTHNSTPFHATIFRRIVFLYLSASLSHFCYCYMFARDRRESTRVILR